VSRRGVAWVVAALAAGVLAGVPGGGGVANADPPPDGVSTPADLAAVSAQAVASGTQLEVTNQRTETTQVFANPDGTFSTTAASRPVRVHKADGSWVDIDPTLRANSDGSVGPAAVPATLRLSGGGSGPLATLTKDGKSLGISWGSALPVPTLNGDVATYGEVLPGVDLQVRATVDGFSSVVVVKNATGAANPAIRTLHFGLSTVGVTASVAADGSLSAVDGGGVQVFAAPPAKMWDSRTANAVAADPTPENRTGWDADSTSEAPGASAQQASAAVQLGTDGLTMEPEVAVLDHGVYPVYIDPETTVNLAAWTEVNSYAPGSVWRTTDNRPAAGHSYDQFGTYTVRSFFGFNTSAVRGARIQSAVMRAFLLHSWSCSPRAVELWALPGGVNARATWNTQNSWSTAAGAQFQSKLNVAKGYTGCAAGTIAFSATPGVARAAAARATGLTFGLKASDENDVFAWKKFEVANPRLVPQLDITYDFAPNPLAARDLSMVSPGSNCVTTPTNAPHLSVSSAGITLRAHATDPDGSQNPLRVNFEWYRTNTNPPTKINGHAPDPDRSGTTFTQSMPRQPDGGYAWRANVQDLNPNTGAVMSTTPWSPYCYFVQDATAPNSPLVTSPQYPGGAADQSQLTGIGRAAQFVIDPNGATDVTSYTYVLNGELANGKVVNVAPGAGATVTITPTEPLRNTLTVQANDSSGNHSDPVAVPFTVDAASSIPVAVMNFEDPAQDSSGTGRTVTPVDVTTVPGKFGNAGHFNGSTSFASTNAAITPYNNFSVSAWARITDPSHTGDVVSFVGTTATGGVTNPFNLAYDGVAHQWVAEFPGVTPTPQARSAQPAGTDWTLLTATYDVAQRRLALYVNGIFSGSATAAISTAAAAGGPLRVFYGATQAGANRALFLAGDIDDVRVWDRTSFGTEVAATGQWELDQNGTDQTPYGRNLTFGSASPTWISDGFGTALAMNGGGNQWAATAGPVLRTDMSYTVAAWVYLNAKNDPNDPNDPGAMAAICQVANRDCPFYLMYRHDLDRWTIDVPNVDSDTPAVLHAQSGSSPQTGMWAELVVVHDANAHTMKLYVGNLNSELTLHSTITVATPFNATGAFNIGRSKWRGAATNYWYGRIDSVRVWGDALAAWEVAGLA
jgi:hypothetical protein